MAVCGVAVIGGGLGIEAMKEFKETLYPDWGQYFSVDEVLFRQSTGHQELVIFRNADYGTVLALDGVVQTTERDEFIYHEMMAHVPIIAHPGARRVLIVGGGDGGMLREVTQHRSVESVTQVEIDASVISTSRRFLPNHSMGAFDDDRVSLVIDDGLHYVRETDSRFDVIISDSTDPIGPGEALYSSGFYEGCRRILDDGGILVTQNGVSFRQLDEVKTTDRRLREVFDDVSFYSAAVPTYVGGIMTFGWACETPDPRQLSLEHLRSRFKASGLRTRYYTPEIHQASFALPRYVRDVLGTGSSSA